MTGPDRMAMLPEELTAEMGRVSATGTRFGGEWAACSGRIGGGEGAIGAGRIAAAFQAAYGPEAEALRRTAEGVPAWFETNAGLGTSSAGRYVAGDADSAAGLDAVG